MDSANIVGKGKQAAVYLHKNKAMKIFYNKPMKDVEKEARLQELACESGLPVPAVHKLLTIGGRTGIVMEYVDGESLGNVILGDMDNLTYYLERFVELQISMHKYSGDNFPKMKELARSRIKASKLLKAGEKRKILSRLKKTEFTRHLCHGDYHLMNLLMTKKQDIYIIDWPNASCGSPAADVCNTYFLLIFIKDELAQLYLDLYCEKSGLKKEEVFELFPLVACTKLSDTLAEKDAQYLYKIIRDYMDSVSLLRRLRSKINKTAKSKVCTS